MARAGSSEARTQEPEAPAPASEAERLALLAEASRLLADTRLAPPTLLELLCALVVPRLGTACHVRLLSEDGKWLRSVAAEHADPAARAHMQRVAGTLQRPDEGPSAEVLRTGRALLLEPREMEQLRRFVPAEQQDGVSLPTSSLLVLPLRARQRLLGTLAVFRDQRLAPFAPAEHFVLQELADRAGMALDLARAYEAERRARHAAEVAAERLARLQRVTEALSEAVTPEDVARVTVEEGIAAIGADQALLLLPSAEDAGRLEAAGHQGFAPEELAHFSSLASTSALPVVEAYRTGAPVWRESRGLEHPLPSTHAVACLPLLERGRPLGVLGFCFHTPRTFTPEERGLLVDLTRQSAQALERAHLYEDAQRAREELQAAHQRLEAIVQSSPAAITLQELDGTVRLWNAASEQIFGWRAEEVLGRINPTVPSERHEELCANLERMGRGESIIGQEMLRQRRDGRLISVSTWATAVRVEGGRLQCLTVLADITERKRAEDALRFLAEAGTVLASSLEHEETLERVAHLAVPTYADGCYVYLLGAGGAVSCVASAHAEGQPALPRELGPLRPGESAVSRVLSSGQPELCADRTALPPLPEREGPALPCEQAAKSYLCVPLQVRGQVVGVLSFVSSRRGYDGQDLALAQELARRAALAIDNARLYREARDAIRLREEFLSIASHELRTPISALQLHVQSLLGALAREPSGPSPERLRRSLETMERQVKRHTQLVHDLLDVSRQGMGQLALLPEPMDLAALAREVASRFEAELERTGTRLTLRADTPVSGRWDRMRLDQVVTNLVANAVKYGRGNPVELAVEREGGRARLTVRDAGIGIAPEDRGRIFNRFERAVSERHYGGFGLGLWITRQVVEAMGGHITVDSELGVGSLFTVELPDEPLPSEG